MHKIVSSEINYQILKTENDRLSNSSQNFKILLYFNGGKFESHELLPFLRASFGAKQSFAYSAIAFNT